MIDNVVKAIINELSLVNVNLEKQVDNADDTSLLSSTGLSIKKVANLLAFIQYDAPAKLVMECYSYITATVKKNAELSGYELKKCIIIFNGLLNYLEHYDKESNNNEVYLEDSRKALFELIPDTSEAIEIALPQSDEIVIENEMDVELVKTESSEVLYPMSDSLYELFYPETEMHIKTVSLYIEDAKLSACNISKELTLALHTMTGSSYLAEIDIMASLSEAMESYCNCLSKFDLKFDQNNLHLLEEFVVTIKAIIQVINKPGAVLPGWEPLLATIKQADKALLEIHTDQSDHCDDGVLKVNNQTAVREFLNYVVASMDKIFDNLTVWKNTPDNTTAKNYLTTELEIFIKQAKTLKQHELADLVSAINSLLNTVSDTDEEVVELVLMAFDKIEEILDCIHLNTTAQDVKKVTVKLLNLIEQHLHSETKIESSNQQEDQLQPESLETETVISTEIINNEMLELFLEEADDLFDQLEAAHADWLEDTSSVTAMDAQLRYLHTFKGSAGLTDLPTITNFCHSLESLFEKLVSGEMAANEKMLILIRDAFDGLHKCIEWLHQKKPLPDLTKITNNVNLATEGKEWENLLIMVGDTTKDFDVDSNTQSHIDQESNSEENKSLNLIRPKKLQFHIQPEVESTIDKKRVRVLTSVLDKLVNDSGEINITQSRLERQNTKNKFNLIELQNTITRLQLQMGKLKLETETQIKSRHYGEGQEQHDKDFDPLEMDRYSNLQQISNSIAETVQDLSDIGESLEESSEESGGLMFKISLAAQDLQDKLLKTRLVPFKQQFTRFNRVVRMASKEMNKNVNFKMEGSEALIDRNIISQMIGPIEHLLRNAVTHGVAAKRAGVNQKSGNITVSFIRNYSNVEIIISDDGAGLDTEKIRGMAFQKGMIDADTDISNDDLYRFIFAPGFSTADKISKLAGRGMGMDVVMDEVKHLDGSIKIVTESGVGTSFIIQLPFMLAITEALMIEVAKHVYALPHGSVDNIIQVPSADIFKTKNSSKQMLEYGGESYPLYFLGSLLGHSEEVKSTGNDWVPVLLINMDKGKAAIHLDQLLGTAQIKVIPIGDQFNRYPWFVDGTLLPNGEIALLLDLYALIHSSDTLRERGIQLRHESDVTEERPTVLIVDDSITVRKVSSRIFERKNMNVLTAKDGVEAITVMKDQIPDIMLLDIEMPRMNGFELAQQMANSDELCNIPIIMITSRTGSKHQQRALEMGVKVYLGKPFKEAEVLSNVYRLLEGSKDE